MATICLEARMSAGKNKKFSKLHKDTLVDSLLTDFICGVYNVKKDNEVIAPLKDKYYSWVEENIKKRYCAIKLINSDILGVYILMTGILINDEEGNILDGHKTLKFYNSLTDDELIELLQSIAYSQFITEDELSNDIQLMLSSFYANRKKNPYKYCTQIKSRNKCKD